MTSVLVRLCAFWQGHNRLQPNAPVRPLGAPTAGVPLRHVHSLDNFGLILSFFSSLSNLYLPVARGRIELPYLDHDSSEWPLLYRASYL